MLSCIYMLVMLTALLHCNEITINVPVVYMGRYEVVLRGDYP